MHDRFRPRYDLLYKAMVYVRSVEVPSHSASPQLRHGVRSDPEYLLRVYRTRAVLEVVHHYTSGHMWVVDQGREPVSGPLDEHISAELLDEITDLQADDAAWGPELLLGLFTPYQGAGLYSVEPAEADWLEWGSSASFDGKLPDLTLRLGHRCTEIVLNHSFGSMDAERQLEAVVSPAGPRDIREQFGEDMARAAEFFAGNPSRWLPGGG